MRSAVRSAKKHAMSILSWTAEKMCAAVAVSKCCMSSSSRSDPALPKSLGPGDLLVFVRSWRESASTGKRDAARTERKKHPILVLGCGCPEQIRESFRECRELCPLILRGGQRQTTSTVRERERERERLVKR
jgi:hypothetical protein